jgi:hypothetical protein
LFLPIIAYTLSSTKLEIKAKQFLPGSEGEGGGREKERKWGEGERNDPNIDVHKNKR